MIDPIERTLLIQTRIALWRLKYEVQAALLIAAPGAIGSGRAARPSIRPEDRRFFGADLSALLLPLETGDLTVSEARRSYVDLMMEIETQLEKLGEFLEGSR